MPGVRCPADGAGRRHRGTEAVGRRAARGKRGAPVSWFDSRPIHRAAKNLPLLDVLLDGALVDVFGAANLGMIDRLRELVDADPSLVHARGGDGKTPLHWARTVVVAQY